MSNWVYLSEENLLLKKQTEFLLGIPFSASFEENFFTAITFGQTEVRVCPNREKFIAYWPYNASEKMSEVKLHNK